MMIMWSIYSLLKPEEKLTIYQPDMVNSELVDTTMQYVRKYHRIKDFKLVNQNGDTITNADYKDKIYIADFFFTTCMTICPIMTDHMVKIQERIKDDPALFIFGGVILTTYGVMTFIQTKKALPQEEESPDIRKLGKSDYLGLALKGFLLNFINVGVLGFWLGLIIVFGPRLEMESDRILVFFSIF